MLDTSVEPRGLTFLLQVIGAIGALGTAAFGLVDASKAFRGGVSNIGFPDIQRALERFAGALDLALGNGEWRMVVHAHWINGRPKDEQKAIVKSLIRLGLAPETAPVLAATGHVNEKALSSVAAKLQAGEPLQEADLNVLGRLDASIEAQLDAAFDRAEQRYRNMSRVLAGATAVILSCVAAWALGIASTVGDLALPALVGVLAVPLAPIAKDLASSLSSAAQAVKAAKNRP